MKALIRESEARSAARACGVTDPSRLHFLNMPCYQTGEGAGDLMWGLGHSMQSAAGHVPASAAREGRSAATKFDCKSCRLTSHFSLPGKVVKDPLGEEDVAVLEALFENVRPHLIFAAGDLSDPHGTHRVCLQAACAALARAARRPWYARCGTEVLLYRGAWQVWAREGRRGGGGSRAVAPPLASHSYYHTWTS